MSELWKPVIGWEGYYEVSSYGRVKSLSRYAKNSSCSYRKLPERLLKLGVLYDGYLGVGLSKNRVIKYFKVHRLVAQAFIPNPENKPVVNHKDGNKQNNNVDNLEWCTHLENIQHARSTGLITKQTAECIERRAKKCRKRVMLKETGQIFESRNDAHNILGVPLVRIYDSLKSGKSISGTTFINI